MICIKYPATWMARNLRLHEHFDRLVDRGKTQSWINNQREERVVICYNYVYSYNNL